MHTQRRTAQSRKRNALLADESGLTLIELTIVIVILGILAAVIAPRVLDMPDRARVSKAKLDIGSIKTALDFYAIDVGNYPTDEQGLDALWRAPSPTPPNWKGPYISTQNSIDPWNNPYVYRVLQRGTRPGYDYELYSLGKDGKIGGENFDADITNWETGTGQPNN